MKRLVFAALLITLACTHAHADTHNYTTTQLFSAGGDKGVAPVDGDAFTISGVGTVVTFDMTNQAAWSGMAASIITSPAVLVAQETASTTYTLTMAGTLTGTGTFQIGTSSSVPFGPTCQFNIKLNATGAYIGLSSSNAVQFYGQSTPNIDITGTWNGATGTTSGIFSAILGYTRATFHNVNRATSTCWYQKFEDCTFENCQNMSYLDRSCIFNDCVTEDSVVAITSSELLVLNNCTIGGGTTGMSISSGTLNSCHFTPANTNHLNRNTMLILDNCDFTGGTVWTLYGGTYLPPQNYSVSTRHNGVATGFQACTSGGIVTDSSASPPTGHTLSYLHTCADANNPCFRQERYRLEPYERATFAIHAKLSVTTWTTDPKVEIIDPFNDPLVDSAQSALVTNTIEDGTGSDNWVGYTITYLNNTANQKTVLLRVTAQDASKLLYERADRIIPSMVGR